MSKKFRSFVERHEKGLIKLHNFFEFLATGGASILIRKEPRNRWDEAFEEMSQSN